MAASIGALITACGSSNDSDSVSDIDAESPLYLVKATDWSADDGISLIYLTESLDSDTEFDPEKALAMDGYHFVSINQTNSTGKDFHLAVDNTSILQRYTISDNGDIALAAELDFSSYGITDARNSLRSGKIYSAEKGYIIDSVGMQVIVFNPTEMTITDSISLAAHAEVDYPNRWSIFPAIDGDRVVVPITYYEADWTSAPLSKLVIVDTATDTVTVDTSTQCGSVSASAVDADGNVYFASHNDIATAYAVEADGSYPPCLIRMKGGADGWDDDYYVNLLDLTDDDRPAMAIMTGEGNKAYTLIYSADEDPLTLNNIDVARGSVWEFHSIELGNEAATVAKIANVEATGPRVQYGSFSDGNAGLTSWMMRINTDYTESTIYDTTDTENWEVLTVVPGALETIARLR